MNLDAVTTTLEARTEAQLRLSGDPAVEAAGAAILEALRPALNEAALAIARQAAEEVAAQLPDRSVDVVIEGDDPMVRIGKPSGEPIVEADELDARITLRLPRALKDLIESVADVEGDSVNSYIVKSLNTNAAAARPSSSRVRGSYDL
jgi:hypothetical protein